MTEKLMQYCWEHRLWRQTVPLLTQKGEEVEVIDTGLRNDGSGPDFFNAKVKIGKQIWAGNVELHINAADWYRHGHHNDKAYSTVVLHVVLNDDGTHVQRPDGAEIPQTQLSISDDFLHSYSELIDSPFASLPCAGALIHIPSLHITDWISALGFERLYDKGARVLSLLKQYGGDWSEVAYITLARALGFGKNSTPFEMLAKATPLRVLLKHRDSLTALEAMLLGQAGFLKGLDKHPDEYVQRLCREYAFFAAKFGLQPIDRALWKTSGMRPGAFPYNRIATLAMMLHEGFRLGSALFEVETVEDARSLLRVPVAEYWQRRYSPGAAPTGMPRREGLSKSSIDLLIINVAAPLVHARGVQLDNRRMLERAVAMLEATPAEKNSRVEPLVLAGVPCRDAFMSQALLQLRTAYCNQRKCLYCRIGHRLLAMSSRH